LREQYLPKKPLIILGGELKLAKNLKIISENWIPSETDGVLCMLGFRFIGKHAAGDIAIVRVLYNNYKPSEIIPSFNFTLNFELVQRNK
jgi:hypothetical protein